MKLCKSSFEIWQQPSGLEGVYKQIEHVGRVCYKSEDKITEDSAKPFVDRMIKSGHGAMLEHGTVYLAMPMETILPIEANGWGKYTKNPYSKGFKVCEVDGHRRVAVTTNLRVLVENDWLDDLQYICEPTEYHERRVTAYFIADAGVMREFFRHRVFSMAQESTRYCNYLRDKFGNSITVIYPCWLKEEEELEFEEDMRVIEELYFKWLKKGWTAQQARVFLPLSVKAEAVMTGFVSDWKHFFSLRSRIAQTGKPHPQAQELADPLMDEFVKKGIMETLL
jgi:thymidylate synthase (FAD)